ncbi:BglG family transcription antiterminator [Pectinatus haikarae]|uniref:Lichenan operon transcriptional antiterminator n=1 Tax=Pectinatus haikarae TaxID=349096 RepID=A0ABT9Y7X8_9FIRM|nr:PRD domain-containing protein [Pectinatus haikarae]MDQ0203943.1 lichenan operon transcriptional antiterminator [Pectinatus haikarae]
MKWFDTENRSIKIIKLLEYKSEFAIVDLSRRLGVSTKTVQNDIRDINAELKGSALIDLNRSVAKLYITDFPQYQKQRSRIERRNSNFDSPQMRMAFIVDMLMNTDSPYLIDELAYAMNISRSTLIKDMNTLKGILQNYNLTIQGQSNIGISLLGEELNLRFFVLDNNYNIICTEPELPIDIMDMIKKELSSLKLDKIVIEHFFRYLTLSVNRSRQGHALISLDVKYQELANHYYYKFLQNSFDKLESMLGIVLSVNERLFLTIPLISMRTPYDISSLESNITVSDDVLKITEEIIAAIKEKMDITLDEKNSDVLDEFVYHNYFLTNRLRYGLTMHNQGNDDIKQKYTVAYHMALIAKKVIEKRMHLRIPEDEVGFLTAYFQIFLTEQESSSNAYKVALICGTGRARAKLIMSQLQKIFERGTVIDIFIYNEQLSESDLEGYDLLISTVKTDMNRQIPVIFINEVVDEDYLKNSIDRIRYAHQLQIPLLHGVRSIVFNLLTEKRVMVLGSDLNYSECVHTMIAGLMDEGQLEKEFWGRIQQREAKSSMVLDHCVAFPHARYDSGGDIVISLGIIPDGLNDELYPELKVIFLVAVPADPNDDAILVKIYDEIISMASSQKVVEDMSKLTNYNDILMYFIKDCDLFN